MNPYSTCGNYHYDSNDIMMTCLVQKAIKNPNPAAGNKMIS